MSDQRELWHDSFEDALRDVVGALGGPKKVGHELWPAKSLADAARYLNHCLDPERAEKLALSEIVWILVEGRRAGIHTAMAWLADECQYTRPEPVTPEDQQAELLRDFNRSVEHLDKLAGKLKRKGLEVA